MSVLADVSNKLGALEVKDGETAKQASAVKGAAAGEDAKATKKSIPSAAAATATGATATGTATGGGSKDSKEELSRVELYISKVRKFYDSAKFGGEWTSDESVSAVETLEGLNFSEVTEAIIGFKGEIDDRWKAALAFGDLIIFIVKDLPTKPGKIAKAKGKNATLNTTFKDWLDDMLNTYAGELNKVWTELLLKSDGKLASKPLVQKARGMPGAGLKDLGDIADLFEQYDEMYGKKKEAKE